MPDTLLYWTISFLKEGKYILFLLFFVWQLAQESLNKCVYLEVTIQSNGFYSFSDINTILVYII